MLAKTKAKAAKAAEHVAAKAAEVDAKHGIGAKIDVAAGLAKAKAHEFDEAHNLSEQAEAAKARAAAKAAELDETHGLTAKAEAAKQAAKEKAEAAKERADALDKEHGLSERASSLKSEAAAASTAFDEKHGLSTKAEDIKAAAAARANALDQKLGEHVTGIDGYVGHTSTLSIACVKGVDARPDWIAWSADEDGLILTKSSKGCSLVQLYKTEAGLYMYQEWDQLSSQQEYLKLRAQEFEAWGSAFEPPKIEAYTDAVSWPIIGKSTGLSEVAGFTVCLTLNAPDAAKYEELLAWANCETGLAFTASQKGMLTLKSYKLGETSMLLWEEWESAEDQAAYMAIRTEEGLMAKLVEDGILAKENPAVVLPLEHVATYSEKNFLDDNDDDDEELGSARRWADDDDDAPRSLADDEEEVAANPLQEAAAAGGAVAAAAAIGVAASAEEGVPPAAAAEQEPEPEPEPAAVAAAAVAPAAAAAVPEPAAAAPVAAAAAAVLCESRVMVQAGGKGDFKQYWLSVDAAGDLKFSSLERAATKAARDRGDVWNPVSLQRSAAAKGATISKPKSARKGFDNAFRMDLVGDKCDDSGLPGLKFIVAIDPEDVAIGGKTVNHWKAALKKVV